MRLLIVEPHATGHHGAYLRWILEGAQQRSLQVVVGTSDAALKHHAIRTLQASHPNVSWITLPEGDGGISADDVSSTKGHVARELAYRKVFGSLYATTVRQMGHIDHVLLPYLDYCAYAMGLSGVPFGNTPMSGLLMRPSFHYAAQGVLAQRPMLSFVKRILFIRLLRNKDIKTVFSLDKPLVNYLSANYPAYASKVNYLPEPVSLKHPIAKSAAQRRLGIPDDVKIILAYGELTRRKGVDVLIHAAEDPSFPPDCHLLLAGTQDEDIATVVRASNLVAAGKLHEINYYLNDDEEQLVFSTADCVWLGYRGHYGMSGVLAQAASQGLPVLACREGLIGWLTGQFQLGLTVDLDNVIGVVATIKILLSQRKKGNTSNLPSDENFYVSAEHAASMVLDGIESNFFK